MRQRKPLNRFRSSTIKIPAEAKRTIVHLARLRDMLRTMSKSFSKPERIAANARSRRQDDLNALTRLLGQMGAKGQDHRDIYDRQYLVPACRAACDRFTETEVSFPCVTLVEQLDQAATDIDDQLQRLESVFRIAP